MLIVLLPHCFYCSYESPLTVRTLLYFQYHIQLTSCVLHAYTHMYETSSPSRCFGPNAHFLFLLALIDYSCSTRTMGNMLYSPPYSPQRGPTRYSTRPLQVPATMYIVYVYMACCYVLWLRPYYAYSYSSSLRVLSALKCIVFRSVLQFCSPGIPQSLSRSRGL